MGWLAAVGCVGEPPEPPSEPVTVISVLPLERGQVAVEAPVVGTIVPVETSRVAAGAAGKVIGYPFREGALVREGEVIARLRDVTIGIELEAARQVLQEREHKAAQLQAGYRPEEVAQAEAVFRSAEAAVELAESNAERTQSLYESPTKPVSDQELENSQYLAERSRQERASAQADFEMKRSGYRPEEVAAAAAAAEAQRQEVARLTDELEKRKVVAPFTGYLVQKQTDVGEWVDLGGIVATLVKLDEVEVRVNVEEAYLGAIQLGQTVEVLVDALGETASAGKFEGHVQSIVPKARWEQGSRSFPVVVRAANRIEHDQPLLKEGMMARITFRGPPRDVLLAHKDAVVRASGRPVLYVIGADQQARPVEVTEGLARGNFVEVRGEVHEGDLVAVEGVERLRPLSLVRFDAPAGPRAPAEPAVVERKPAEEPKSSGG